MYWLIAGIVVVAVGVAVAWWSSGRAKPRTSSFDADREEGENLLKHTTGGTGGLGGNYGGVG